LQRIVADERPRNIFLLADFIIETLYQDEITTLTTLRQIKLDKTMERILWDIYHSRKEKVIIIQTSDWFRGIVYIPANPL
jgi:hypothetical protein